MLFAFLLQSGSGLELSKQFFFLSFSNYNFFNYIFFFHRASSGSCARQSTACAAKSWSNPCPSTPTDNRRHVTLWRGCRGRDCDQELRKQRAAGGKNFSKFFCRETFRQKFPNTGKFLEKFLNTEIFWKNFPTGNFLKKKKPAKLL